MTNEISSERAGPSDGLDGDSGTPGFGETLPGGLYLIAYDPRKHRLTARFELGFALRAAALVDLQLRGHVRDDAGYVRTEPGARAADPLLEAVRMEIAEAPPRAWLHWVRTGHRNMPRAVAEHLHAIGELAREDRRILGMVTTAHLTPTDPAAAARLVDGAAQVLRSDRSVLPADPRIVALAVLAATAELPTVVGRSERRSRRQQIAQLGEVCGPAVPALRRAIRGMRAAASGGS
ncbi:MAG: GPP34 family phosphoprotein [Actinomycetota bacterium]|nr:GPP34 family phosphoprotein [Actinomycetota bacterium]